jgi:hypothetical protein
MRALGRAMSFFGFAFSLFVILLGLGLTEVFGGLARAMKARPKVRIGWATGLLATWTITRTALFWRLIWRTRDTFPDSSAALLGGVLICGLFYFAGALVFPDALDGRTGLDDYFMQEKAKAIGALLAAEALSYALRPALLGWASWSYMGWLDWSGLAVIFGAGSVAMLTKRRELAIGSLVVLVADGLMASVARAILPI